MAYDTLSRYQILDILLKQFGVEILINWSPLDCIFR